MTARVLIFAPHGAEPDPGDAPDTPIRSFDYLVDASGFKGTGALVYGGDDTASRPGSFAAISHSILMSGAFFSVVCRPTPTPSH